MPKNRLQETFFTIMIVAGFILDSFIAGPLVRFIFGKIFREN